jgi:2,3-bisphosphoglycerate-dependent phosphoglycerate mutase
MAKIFAALIRHGDYQQLAETPSAHQPFPLTAKGFEQAAELAPLIQEYCRQNLCRLNPVIASSKLLRAWQTASKMITEINETGIIVEEHTELAERCVGGAANLTEQQISHIVKQDPRFADLPKDWKSNSHFCLPFQGAESLLAAGIRVANFLNAQMRSLQQQSQSDQLKIFVGHGAAFRHAAYHLGILEFEQIAQLSMFHCQPVFLEYINDDNWQHVGGAWKVRNTHSLFTD